jgi:hypothetical protein
MIAGCTDVVVFIVFQFGWQPIQFKFWNPHQAHSDLQFNVDFSLVSIAWLHRPCLPRTMLITTHACTPPPRDVVICDICSLRRGMQNGKYANG